MKLINIICFTTFLLYVVGRELLPDIFRNIYVFWALSSSLALMLSYGFSKSISIYYNGSKAIRAFTNPACYLFLFLYVMFIPINVIVKSQSLSNNLPSSSKPLQIINTSSPETEESRMNMASYIFDEYGIQIPYRLDSNNYSIFQPSDDQISKYHIQIENRKQLENIKYQLGKLRQAASNLIIIQFAIFFITFTISSVFQNININISHKVTNQ